MGTVKHINRAEPDISYLLHTLRMVEPIVFKPKDISFWNIGANLNFARQVIRSNPSKGLNHSERENTSPSNRGKKPVNLFQQGVVMHVTPGIAYSLDRQFDQPQVTNDVIENQRIMEVTPGLFLFSAYL
jgi:hypothetical protein